MALIHENSCACVGSQLDIFSVPGTQTSQEKNAYVPYYPISSLDDGPLEFDVKQSNMYTDLGDTRLYLRCKIVKRNGDTMAATDTTTACNMFFHALIQRLDIYVGDTLITQSGGFYPWKAGIETLLNFGSDAKASQLGNIMYYKDVEGNNTGQTARSGITKASSVFEMWGPLHVDLFMQNKYLINNVPVRVKITRNNPEFCLVTAGNDDAHKIVILEAVLFVRRVQVAPSVELSHSKMLLGGKNAIYPLNRGEVEVMSVPPNQQTVCRNNLFMSRLPKKLIIGMVDNKAFNGDYKKLPFYFKHYDISSLEVSVDGENVAGTPLALDFAQRRYVRAYDGLFHAINKSYTDNGSDITYDDYKNGYALFCFDLTADGCGNTSDHLELSRQGNLRIKLQFDKPLPETINVICYGEFESMLEITNTREVLLDYKN
jgi:hypothetical protein